MNRWTLRSAVKALVCLHLALTTTSALGAADPADGVDLVVGRDFVQWSLVPGQGPATLSVSDPAGSVQTYTFAPGVAPVLWLTPTSGRPLEDGTYTWELRVQSADPTGPRATKPAVHFGYLTLRDGDVVSGDQPEPVFTPNVPAARPRRITAPDQTVPDDLIVDGKACVGLACVPNEAFQAEALRLKQSVVRLRFEDTSSAGGFPGRDWQLTANDSAMGGVEKFSLEDLTAVTTPFTVVGAAPSNALYVAGTTGNVGLGTAVPAQRLHLAAASTPAIRLEQTGGTPQTWDLGFNGTKLLISNVTNGTPSFTLTPSTTFPQSVLEIAKTSASPGLQSMFKLSNYGGVQFLLHRSDTNVDWQFSNFGQTFEVSRPGLPGTAQLLLTELGELKIGGKDKPEYAFFIGGGAPYANRVGIGTTTPASKLEVKDGDIRVTNGSFLDDGMPVSDYVFAPDYPLMPLGEVAAFVARERHLPNVPSGEEIARSGLDLGQFQMKLLEKIEELTLYVLAQDREIDEQRTLIEELRRRLEQQGAPRP